jgi:alpha-L-fucosidase
MNDRFIRNTFGEQVTYWDFGKLFRGEFFNPDQWAGLFARAGAKYVAFTTKMHDGFCMWPTTHSWPKDCSCLPCVFQAASGESQAK